MSEVGWEVHAKSPRYMRGLFALSHVSFLTFMRAYARRGQTP